MSVCSVCKKRYEQCPSVEMYALSLCVEMYDLCSCVEMYVLCLSLKMSDVCPCVEEQDCVSVCYKIESNKLNNL